MSFRQHGGLPPNLEDTEVTDMTAYEILSLVVGIIGLVFTAILVVVTIHKRQSPLKMRPSSGDH